MKVIIIDNLSSNKNKKELYKVVKEKYSTKIKIIKTKNSTEVLEILKYSLENKIKTIISVGGDGTINNLINCVMKLDKKDREKLNLSVLQYGKANDLANRLGISKSPHNALKQILIGNRRKQDIIKVNEKYFITGGGFGLLSDIVEEKDKKKNLGFMKDKLYLMLLLRSFFFGYDKIKEVKINNLQKKNLSLIAIMNQQFIGKRFFLTPQAKENDGFFDLCLIKEPFNFIKRFYILNKIIKKQHTNFNWAEAPTTF